MHKFRRNLLLKKVTEMGYLLYFVTKDHQRNNPCCGMSYWIFVEKDPLENIRVGKAPVVCLLKMQDTEKLLGLIFKL